MFYSSKAARVGLFAALWAIADACTLNERPDPPGVPAAAGTGGAAGQAGQADANSDDASAGTSGEAGAGTGGTGTGGTSGGAAGSPDGSGGTAGTAGSGDGSGAGGADTGGASGGAAGAAGASDAASEGAAGGAGAADGSTADGAAGAGDSAGGSGGDAACADSWVIEYRLHGDPPPGPPPPLDRTTFRILLAGFSLDIRVGDHTDSQWQCLQGGQNCLAVGPGSLRLRFRDAGGRPADGRVTLKSYANSYDFALAFLETRFAVDADGVLPSSPPSTLEPDHPAPVCEAAVGALSGTRIVWTTPTVDHRTHGSITCNSDPSTCALAGLSTGENHQDHTYAIVFKPFRLSEAPSTGAPAELSLDEGANPDPASIGIEIPTPNPSTQGRSFIIIKGVEVGRALEPSPPCFCR
jgi:hypothetical protein